MESRLRKRLDAMARLPRAPLILLGVDEAGRGPLAGPVTAAAVALPPGAEKWGLGDSKVLGARRRGELESRIKAEAVFWALGWASPEEIDRLNILEATMLAMRRAVAGCGVLRAWVLVDGPRCPRSGFDELAVVKGDAKVREISAASILAKQARDAEMRRLDAMHPGYGLAIHMGYPTRQHREALELLGPAPIHRRSFGPVRAAIAAR